MNDDGKHLESQVADLDGAIAEFVDDGAVAGWLAVQAAPFRDLLLTKQVGCWLLFTWADGSLEIEEDYPPFALLPELRAGSYHDEDRRTDYEVRWVTGDRRRELWERFGIHEDPGYYMAQAHADRRRVTSGELPVAVRATRRPVSKLLRRHRFTYEVRSGDGTVLRDVDVDQALQGRTYPGDAWATRQAAEDACPMTGTSPWIEYATGRQLPE